MKKLLFSAMGVLGVVGASLAVNVPKLNSSVFCSAGGGLQASQTCPEERLRSAITSNTTALSLFCSASPGGNCQDKEFITSDI